MELFLKQQSTPIVDGKFAFMQIILSKKYRKFFDFEKKQREKNKKPVLDSVQRKVSSWQVTSECLFAFL